MAHSHGFMVDVCEATQGAATSTNGSIGTPRDARITGVEILYLRSEYYTAADDDKIRSMAG
jgi:hypothetical protein